MADSGPYRDERQARAAALTAIPPEPGWSILRTHQNRELLARALEAAGVETTPYEDGTVAWLAGFEDTTCQVIAGWIRRAYEAGKAAATESAAETEWGISYPAGHPEERVRNFGSEDGERVARMMLPDHLKAYKDKARLVYREIGPWKEVPGA